MLISEIDRYGFYYPLVICKGCGLMRANPRMTKESYLNFYAHKYRNAYGEGDKPIAELFEYRVKQGQEKYKYFKNSIYLPPRGIIFEIGCDFGTMLLPFSEHGYDVYGCDYGIEHIEYGCTKTNLKNLFIGGIEKLSELNKKADLIILQHVLEHLLELEAALKQIRDLLKPSGICYVAVPGTYGRTKNRFRGNNDILSLLQNAHIYQFNLVTLQYVMECCGFEFIKGNEAIEAFFKYSNKFRKKADCLKEEIEKNIKYLRATERKFLIKQIIFKFLDNIGVNRKK